MAPKKAANGYKLPEPLPKGEILEDRSKKKWKLGISIGKGGFGEIYSAQPLEITGSKYPNVIKIEPHANGPLFVEMHFYMRNGKPEEIEEFKKEKKLSTFGMPAFLGSGSHEYKGEKYRFVVMEKFGTDLWKIFLENKKKFPEATVFQLGVQILDVLEYIHRHGYVHADIKGANILMGITKETKDKQVYVVDFGLATKFSVEKEFKPNPKKAHDGTIEYLSRDAHQGVQTRRGDLEILIYNLIQWLGCTLPWEKTLTDPKTVEKSKESNMETVAKMTKASFGNKKVPEAITLFLNYLKTLKFNIEPDYEKLRKILIKGVKDAGGTVGGILQFSATKTPSKRKSDVQLSSPKRKQKKIPASNQDDSMDDLEIIKQKINSSPVKKRGRKPKADSAPTSPIQNGDFEEDEENIKTQVLSKKQTNGLPLKRGRKPKQEIINIQTNSDPLAGYTDAMKQIIRKRQENEKTKKPKRPRRATVDIKPSEDNEFDNYTESMKEIAMKRLRNKKTVKTDLVPIATTSKAATKKGLVQKNSKRLQDNLPQTHAEIVGSTNSESDY